MLEPLESYREKQAVLDDAVRVAVAAVFDELRGMAPERMRDELIKLVPALVERYGAVSAELATEFYESMLPAGSRFVPLPSSVVAGSSATVLEEGVRYQAGKFFAGDIAGGQAGVSSLVARHVRLYGRQTMLDNAHREGVGWARVPRGPKTCSFCLVLSGRGVTYSSEKSASSPSAGEDYHDYCNCEVIRVGHGESYPPGYLPDEYESMYKNARDKADDPGDIKSVLFEMRRLYPDVVRDGVTAK